MQTLQDNYSTLRVKLFRIKQSESLVWFNGEGLTSTLDSPLPD